MLVLYSEWYLAFNILVVLNMIKITQIREELIEMLDTWNKVKLILFGTTFVIKYLFQGSFNIKLTFHTYFFQTEELYYIL